MTMLGLPQTKSEQGLWQAAFEYARIAFKAALPRFMIRGGLRQKKDRHSTAYLDALRGYAAFAVINHHKFLYQKTWLMQMPFFRLFWAGNAMVYVFFVISGYVLSYSMLVQMRARNGGKIFDKVTSALFRRYIRLYGSSAIATFIAMVLVRMRWGDPNIKRFGSHSAQLSHWIMDTVRFGNPFCDLSSYFRLDKGALVNHYAIVLWTIPVEYRASIFIYVFCLATARLSYRNRTLVAWLIVGFSYWWLELYPAAFLFGLLIADANIERNYIAESSSVLPQQVQSAADSEKPAHAIQSRRARLFFTVVAISALAILGYPSSARAKGPWPWHYLYNSMPSHFFGSHVHVYFWGSTGAPLLIWALDSYPTLQAPLKWDFSLYLGDISFGIYVMHNQVIFSLMNRILVPWRRHYLGDGLWSAAPITVLNWIAVLWAADLFSRLDKQVVRFARWLEMKAFVW